LNGVFTNFQEHHMAKVTKRVWTTKAGEQHSAWQADYFSPGANGERQRHSKTFKTRREAVAWLAHTVVEIRQGVHCPAHKSPTVLQAGEAWIKQAEADGLERSSVMQYRQHLDLHIAPFVGLHRLADLTPAAVQSFRAVLLAQGRSRAMVARAVSSLGSIIAQAMSSGLVARNVVHEASRHDRRAARVEKRHKRQLQVGLDIPTKLEIRAMIANAGPLRPLLTTAIFAGLRASELRGLTWDAVDLDRKLLVVRARADRWNVIGSPKSDAGKREVPLAPIVVNVLREWKLACPRFADSEEPPRLWLVFPTATGNVQRLAHIHRRLGPVQHAAGITDDPARPKYGMHSLRHACASLLIEQGFNAKRVQALMGHSTIAMTLDIYTHLFPSQADDEAAMAQMQARLLG
jgi:integrase